MEVLQIRTRRSLSVKEKKEILDLKEQGHTIKYI